ncbi:MAG: nucleotide exchange factor GrpE [Phycisphaerales bacterium]
MSDDTMNKTNRNNIKPGNANPSDTDEHTIDIPESDTPEQIEADFDAMANAESGSEVGEAFDAERSARLETIRQMALSGELEYSPESEEIVEALVETIAQRDDNFGRFQAMAAEHQNFQRRASMNEQEARISSRQGVVQALIPLMDNFEMALMQDPEKVSPKDVIAGVQMIQSEFLRMLSGYGVSAIEPKVGDEFNPGPHAAMMQQAAEGVDPGHISVTMGVGYKLGERVIRPAKVAVAPDTTDESHVDAGSGGEG